MDSHLGWLAGRKERHMKITRFLSHAVLMFALVFTLSNFTLAQDDQVQDQDQNQPDPPSRVGRVNMVQGSVSFQPGGEGDWVDAVPNRPLTTGDNLWADQNSRAEVHVGSTAIRLNSESSMTILDLDDRTTQLKLSQGSMILRVRHVDDGDTYEVDTPNLAFDIQRTGEYRIDVSDDGNQTDVSVFSGRGEVTGGGYSYTVVGGQDARFTGSEKLDYDINQLPDRDDFTKWAMDRDHREDGPESADYVSPEMTGYEDLDDYGRWTYVAGYGSVWYPSSVAADWAPYRYGHWVYVQPWGWTWVEDEPWGFAPFHYGRWAYAGNRWCWVPGPVVVRPVYAPALVAFVGGGNSGFHFSINIGGGGGVGWFPLGPGEVYVPSYRVSRVYVNNINVTNTRVNVTQITNVYNVYNGRGNEHITYVNQRVTNSVTVVTHDTFVNARAVNRNIVRVDAREINSAPVFHRPMEQPVRQSVFGAGAPARFQPPARIVNRQVIGTRTPPPVREPLSQRPPMNNVREERPEGQPRQLGNNTHPQDRGMPEGQQVHMQPRPQVGGEAPRPSQPPVATRPPEPPRDNGRENNNNDDRRNGMRQPQGNDNNRVQQPNPTVRQAPPVREKPPQEQQNEERKFRNWDEQRRNNAPRTENKPQEHRPEPREQKPAPKPPNRFR
jgi:hypothetical protein